MAQSLGQNTPNDQATNQNDHLQHDPTSFSPTRRRKALLVGINYFGQRGQLRGCINDVADISRFVNLNFAFSRGDMVVLTDDQHNPMSQPTKANILRGMHWLVKDIRPSDSLFFYYSGHAGHTRSTDSDEDNGYSECIYPVDFRSAGHIMDEEMHKIMVRPLPSGARLTAIFDSSNSGSALDLPYIYSTHGILKAPVFVRSPSQRLLSIVSAYARGDLAGFVSTAASLKPGDGTEQGISQTTASPADVIVLSVSSDMQTLGGEVIGTIARAFITVLGKNPQQSYIQLLKGIRDEFPEIPNSQVHLSCSHPLGKVFN